MFVFQISKWPSKTNRQNVRATDISQPTTRRSWKPEGLKPPRKISIENKLPSNRWVQIIIIIIIIHKTSITTLCLFIDILQSVRWRMEIKWLLFDSSIYELEEMNQCREWESRTKTVWAMHIWFIHSFRVSISPRVPKVQASKGRPLL